MTRTEYHLNRRISQCRSLAAQKRRSDSERAYWKGQHAEAKAELKALRARLKVMVLIKGERHAWFPSHPKGKLQLVEVAS